MNKTITTIALSVAFLSSAAMANTQVTVNTGLQSTLDVLSKHPSNGTALNLAINTNTIDATVNTNGRFNSLNNVGDKIAVETSALGAVNTGSINLQQGSINGETSASFTGNLDASKHAESALEQWRTESSSHIDGSISAAVNASYYDKFSETLSNYTAANIAFNSAAIDASVNTKGFENHIDGIKTSAIGAVNTGSITVTVK